MDYGNKECVPKQSLKSIPPDFIELPKQAVHCFMDQVFCTNSDMWSDAEIDGFYALTDSKTFMVRFISLEIKEHWRVEMFDGNTSVNQLFGSKTKKLSQRFQSQRPPPSHPTSNPAPGSKASMAASGEPELGPQTETSKPMIGTSGNGKFGTDRQPGFSRKGSNFSDDSDRSHQSDRSVGSGQTSRIGPRAVKQPPSPAANSKVTLKRPDLKVEDYVDVLVQYSVNPSEFYCYLGKSTTPLDTIMDEMNAEYSHLEPGDLSVGLLQTSDFCCAQYSQDDRWYRAQVLANKGSSVQVHFVDYGNNEEVSLARVKKLDNKYTSLPEQAFRCSLFGVHPLRGNEWSDEAIAKFDELVYDKNLVGGIVEKSGDCHIVELINIDIPVHQVLIDIGLAEGTEELVAPPKQLVSRRTSAASNASNSSKASSASRHSTSSNSKNLQYTDPTIKLDQFIDVSVAFAESPSLFWCQLLEHSAKLNELMARLEKEYSSMAESELSIVNPQPQKVCAAKYRDDDTWYRALILKVTGSDIKVKFIDYGNEETTTMDRLKTVAEEVCVATNAGIQMQSVWCGL